MITAESYLIYFECFLDKIQSSIINVISTLKQYSLNTKFNRECHYKLKIPKIQKFNHECHCNLKIYIKYKR